ncbi:MAG: hypothetical protein WCJ58_09050 [bacterium]
MINITENKIKSEIKSITEKPGKDWQDRTAFRLALLQEQQKNKNSVTESQLERNSFYNLFNFIKTNPMQIKKVFITSAVTLVGLGVLTSGTVFAAENSKPGDSLFGLEKSIENVQRSFTFSQSAKTKLEAEILKERIAELKSTDSESVKESDALKEVVEQEDRVETEVEKDKKDNKVDQKTEDSIAEAKAELEAYLLKLQIKLAKAQAENNAEQVKELAAKIVEIQQAILNPNETKEVEDNNQDNPEPSELETPEVENEQDDVSEKLFETTKKVEPTEKPETSKPAEVKKPEPTEKNED